MEVYFPDSGWVFYDLSNSQRGFRKPNSIIGCGYSYLLKVGQKSDWVRGYHLIEKDMKPYNPDFLTYKKPLRKAPKNKNVLGVVVKKISPGSYEKVRHRPIRELIMNADIPPGPRKYDKFRPLLNNPKSN